MRKVILIGKTHNLHWNEFRLYSRRNLKVEMCINRYVLITLNFKNHNIKTTFLLTFHLVVWLSIIWFLVFYYLVTKDGRVYEYITTEWILWVLTYNFNWKKALFIGFSV